MSKKATVRQLHQPITDIRGPFYNTIAGGIIPQTKSRDHENDVIVL